MPEQTVKYGETKNRLVYDAVTGNLKEESETTDRTLLTQVNEKLDEIVKIFKKLEERVEDVDARLEGIEGDVEEALNKLEDSEYDNISDKVETLESEFEELKDVLRNV